uniref:Ribosome assembly factor mrt4 (Trinotate prediction) n=1 Tax=Henneguya salminicola TaxID=69463 RepID=A0A6G3MIG0_HENSL
MAKNKRSKPVSLTETKKQKRSIRKASLKEKITDSLQDYSSVYVFSVNDMRNAKLKNVREALKDCRIFFGNNKIISVVFGRKPEEESANNIHQLTQYLEGEVGVLFTNQKKKFIENYFQQLSVEEFSRAGAIASRSITLSEGI